MIAGIACDVRQSTRRLRRSPVHTVTTVATLAFGIALNTVLFSLANVALFREQPVTEPDQLVHVGWYSPASPERKSPVAWPEFLEISARDDVFSGVTAYKTFRRALRIAEGAPIVVSGELVSGGYFDVLGVSAQRGRLLTASDEASGASAPVAVIGDGLWRRVFAGRDDAVGTVVHLNGHPFTIVGVAPPGFNGLVMPMVLQEDLWVPMAWAGEVLGASAVPRAPQEREDRRDHLSLVARLARNASMPQARAALEGLSRHLITERHDDEGSTVLDVRAGATRGRQDVTTVATAMAGTLLMLGAVLLLVTCANLANLVLVRGVERRGELAIHLALGATRAHLLRYLMVEHAIVGMLAAAVAVVGAAAVIPLLAHLNPPAVLGHAVHVDPVLDWRVAGYAVVLAIVTIVVVGLIPSRTASRVSLIDVMRSAPAVVGRPRWLRARPVLTVVQVSASVMLLVFAGSSVVTLRALRDTDVGLSRQDAAVARVDLAMHGYGDDDVRRFASMVTDEAARPPGVRLAAVTSQLPAPDAGSIRVSGASDIDPDATSVSAGVTSVSPAFFDVVGVPVVAGRVFSDMDREGSPRVAVVSSSLAGRLAATLGQAVGQSVVLRLERDDIVHEVIGVVGDTKRHVIRDGSEQVYLSFDQRPRGDVSVVARMPGSTGHAIDPLVQLVRTVAPDVAVMETMALTDVFTRYFYPFRVSAFVLACLGLGAVTIAGLGVYGVIAFSASLRTREMGIRAALGATRGDIVRLVLREAAGIAAVGLGMGLTLSVPAGALAAHVVWGLAAANVWVWASTVLFVGAMSLAAAFPPARRAARIDPAAALRVP